jgi:hypothetical protein
VTIGWELVPVFGGRLRHTAQLSFEVGDRIGQQRRMAAPLNREAQGPIQLRELIGPEAFRLSLPQTNPGHALAVLDLVIQWDSIAPDVQSGGECCEPLTGALVYQLRRIDRDPRPNEVIPTGHPFHSVQDQPANRLRRELGQRAARAAPQLVHLGQGAAKTGLVWMAGVPADQGVGQELTGLLLEVRWDLSLDRSQLRLELETQIGPVPLQQEALLFPGSA